MLLLALTTVRVRIASLLCRVIVLSSLLRCSYRELDDYWRNPPQQ
jgi:hypothetical protein